MLVMLNYVFLTLSTLYILGLTWVHIKTGYSGLKLAFTLEPYCYVNMVIYFILLPIVIVDFTLVAL